MPLPTVFITDRDLSQPASGPLPLGEVTCRELNANDALSAFRAAERIGEWFLTDLLP